MQEDVCSLQSFLRSLSVPRDFIGIQNVKSHSGKEGRGTGSNKKDECLGPHVYPVGGPEFIAYEAGGIYTSFVWQDLAEPLKNVSRHVTAIKMGPIILTGGRKMGMPVRNVPSPEIEPAALLLAPFPQVALELRRLRHIPECRASTPRSPGKTKEC